VCHASGVNKAVTRTSARMPPPTRVVRFSRTWWGWATAVPMARPRLINSPVSSTLLLVGAIGIANGTVIGVLERRGEIGLCPALGAGRHIRYQFLWEMVVRGHRRLCLELVETPAEADLHDLVDVPTRVLTSAALAAATGGE
jgi:hypothetical protein